MNYSKIRVAVSGAGGGVGQSIIKSLQDTDYEVVALDGEALGTGLYAAKTSYVIPYASDPSFVDTLLRIFRDESCDYFFPGLDAELPVLSANAERFASAGVTVVVSDPSVIEAANNKMATYSKLIRFGLQVPRTVDLSVTGIEASGLSIPYVIKQREGGARSQNLFIIRNERDLNALRNNGPLTEYIAQEYVEGDEYTCGTINLDGECKGVIVMRRILRDGDTYKCFSVLDQKIEDEVRKAVNALKPFGACNVQLRVKDGKAYIFEINARCSGTTAARTLCGFNEPKMILDFLSRGIEPRYEIEEKTILRYWKELVVSNADVNNPELGGRLQTGAPRLL